MNRHDRPISGAPQLVKSRLIRRLLLVGLLALIAIGVQQAWTVLPDSTTIAGHQLLRVRSNHAVLESLQELQRSFGWSYSFPKNRKYESSGTSIHQGGASPTEFDDFQVVLQVAFLPGEMQEAFARSTLPPGHFQDIFVIRSDGRCKHFLAGVSGSDQQFVKHFVVPQATIARLRKHLRAISFGQLAGYHHYHSGISHEDSEWFGLFVRSGEFSASSAGTGVPAELFPLIHFIATRIATSEEHEGATTSECEWSVKGTWAGYSYSADSFFLRSEFGDHELRGALDDSNHIEGDLRQTRVTDAGLRMLWNQKFLGSLFVGLSDTLTVAGLREFAEKSGLKFLSIDVKKRSLSVEPLLHFSSVSSLRLENCDLDGEQLSAALGSPNLNKFVLGHCNIHPENLTPGLQSSVTRMHFFACQRTAEFPWEACSQLESLILTDLKIDRELIDRLGAVKSLKELTLWHCPVNADAESALNRLGERVKLEKK